MNTDTDVTTNSTRRLQGCHHPTYQCIIIVLSYVPTHFYITINNSRRRRKRLAKSVIIYCSVLIIRSYNIFNCTWKVFLYKVDTTTDNTDDNTDDGTTTDTI